MVLIIEDDGMTRHAVARLLAHDGISVRSAASLAEGRRQLSLLPRPHCLIVDVMLPDGTGTDLISEARAAGIQARTAIVTGSVMPDTARMLKSSCGADAVFLKPVDVRELLRWVQQCCGSN